MHWMFNPGHYEIHYTFAVEEETNPQAVKEQPDVALAQKKKKKKYFAHIKTSTNGTKFHHMPFQIDTAATVNTIGKSTLTSHFPDVKIRKSKILISPYGNSKLIQPVGEVDLLCERNKQYFYLTFIVVADEQMKNKPALLSGEDCENMGIVKIKADEVHAVNDKELKPDDIVAKTAETQPAEIIPSDDNKESCVENKSVAGERKVKITNDSKSRFPLRRPLQKDRDRMPKRVKFNMPTNRALNKEDITKHFKGNFEGIGKLGPPVKLKLKPNVTPVQMPIHRVPISKRLKEKLALKKLEEAGFIERVKEPTEWCSNILCRESTKKFRVCVDPSQTINKAIERPVFQMPTLKEQLHKLKKAKVFSVIDVKDGFFHVPLDHASSFLTTMHTSYGRYRWLVLPNGISSAPEEFQMRLLQVLEGLSGIIVIADDILVFGSGDTEEEAEADHDRNLVALMERAEEMNLKFNKEKFQFKKKEVKYVGHILTANGIKADPEKVKAVSEMKAPSDVAGVRRFIGMINFLSPYCENLSTTIRPLTELTKAGMVFNWSQNHDKAFEDTKRIITEAPVLQYFDLEKPVVLQVDASKDGLGGALMQPNDDGRLQPISYTSCSLNKTEKNYSQIEKECLAICNAFQKYDQWLYGKKQVTVHTDHQPLETIFKKSLNKAPARLQKMMMNLQRYQFKVEYKKGTSLHIADTLSRSFLSSGTCESEQFEVFRIDVEHSYQTNHPHFRQSTQEKLQQETQRDPTLSKLMNVLLKGWPMSKSELPTELCTYWNYRDELTVNGGMIYKGDMVLVPNSMIKGMLEKLHKHHFGAASTIRLARDVFFWPGMRSDIADMCSSCADCAKFSKATPKEPMKSLPIPTLPWQIVSQDLFEWEGKTFLVTVCHFSDWLEVDELESIDSDAVIKCTKAHFGRFGVPQICHTDNGSQFISDDYHKKFAAAYGFKHTRSSPYHSKGNGRAEAAVKVCKTMLKKCDDIQAALLNYRNTPQLGHSYSPAQRLLNHRTRTLLPTSNKLLQSKVVDAERVTSEIIQKRETSKRVYDRTAGRELEPLTVGSHAYVKPPPSKRGKEWAFGQVVRDEGNRSYTIRTPISSVRRNRCQLTPAAPPRHPIQPVVIRASTPQQIDYPRTPVVEQSVSKRTYAAVTKDNHMSNNVPTTPGRDTDAATPEPTTVATPPVVASTSSHGRPVRVKNLPKKFTGFVME